MNRTRRRCGASAWAFVLLMLLLVCGLAGCGKKSAPPAATSQSVAIAGSASEADVAAAQTESPDDEADEASDPEADAAAAQTESPDDETDEASDPEASAGEQADTSADIDERGSYTSRDDVALYLHTYGHLPDNFITKNEARDLGWDSRAGNLGDVAPGMSIGGDRFGNYEGLLPDGDYHECDINYSGGRRGAERIVYADDGAIYYTGDHYETFEQLY